MSKTWCLASLFCGLFCLAGGIFLLVAAIPTYESKKDYVENPCTVINCTGMEVLAKMNYQNQSYTLEVSGNCGDNIAPFDATCYFDPQDISATIMLNSPASLFYGFMLPYGIACILLGMCLCIYGILQHRPQRNGYQEF